MAAIQGKVYAQPWLSSRYLGPLGNMAGWSHEILANGGFWSASWSDQTTQAAAERWYERGLGRRIIVYETGGKIVFRGFVNTIAVTIGKARESRGPLLEVINRASATFTPRDFSVYPPADGTQTSTIITQNTDSQGRFGIQEEIIEAGQTTLDIAEKVRDRLLLDRRYPKSTGDLSLSPSASEMATLELEILGDVHWLKRFIYSSTSQSLITVNTKILAILAADPNAIMTASDRHLIANAYLVWAFAEGRKNGFDILYNDLIGLGDAATDERIFLGFYEDNTPWLTNVPTSIAYQYKIGDNRQALTTYGSSAIVAPWMIRPGRWVTVPDFIKGRRVLSSDLFSDPRNKLIESVRFTAPSTVDLSGGATDRLSQMLAKISYTGGIY